MRDEDQRAFEQIQRGVQRFDRFHIQVIRGFIHQHHVGMQEHHAAKHHAALLPPGNHVHRLLHIIAREEEATQCAADQCFDIRAFVTTGTHITRNPVGQILVGGKVGGMILGEVTDLGFLGPLDGAGRRGEFALQ